ncbi:hypothetical protein [Vibrio hippocampi]|uniref:Uncharacterized protein n=1 Tax=Vibrio hippocampi TaxID=654686 RepID=A0ABM8ZFK0_9VIBR|nr:hypothetical protein [Vibrio hippocampi]CAH0524456.1 hypothetical protein VHP8226_00283 [Vibrio hippocampi]
MIIFQRKKLAFIIAAFLILLLMVNYFIWNNKRLLIHSDTNANSSDVYYDDYSVDKLNSQAPIVKLRKELLNHNVDEIPWDTLHQGDDVVERIKMVEERISNLEEGIK